MNAQEAQKTLRQELQTTRDELWRLADEIRVHVHLAGMEVKNRWSTLEPELRDFEQRVENAAGKIGSELEAIGTELKSVSTDLKKRLQKLRGELS